MASPAFVLIFALAPTIAAAGSAKCPGSKAWVHASCSVEAVAAAECGKVMAEMKARIAGQYGKWHDPHNNGTYKYLSGGAREILVSRTTGSKSFGNKTYTDKVLYEFADQSGSCKFTACSESQGTSFKDFSTNYCNIRNLYCGSADGCSVVNYDFTTAQTSVSPSLGAGTDATLCLTESLTDSLRSDIGGFYIDPNHYKNGTFAGTRMISANAGDAPSAVITLVGSDDSKNFWTLHGKFTSNDRSDLVIDFSPKGGPSNLNAKYADGRITFRDGNVWSKLAAPSDPISMEATSDIGGFYTDPNHFKPGTFGGTRTISDLSGKKPSDDLILVGSDDGSTFWTLAGQFTSKAAGTLVIDFSPKGGPKHLGATYHDGRITFADGNSWSRVGSAQMVLG